MCCESWAGQESLWWLGKRESLAGTRPLEPQDLSWWERLCFRGTQWQRELPGGRCSLTFRQQAAIPCPERAAAMLPPEYVSCLFSGDFAPEVCSWLTSTPEGYTVVCAVKKTSGSFWEGSCGICVTGKRSKPPIIWLSWFQYNSNKLFHHTINSYLIPPNFGMLFKLFLIKCE